MQNTFTSQLKFVLYGVCVLLGFTAQAQQEYTMEWLDPVGATISDSSVTVTKTAANGWNNSGAVGRYYLQGGHDGWIEYTVNSTTERKAVGFADYNQNNTYYTTDYALYLGGDAKFYAAMNGALMANVTVSVGDVLRLERVGDEMKFMKNGTPIYTADSVITSLLIPDIAIYTNGAVFTDVTASFGRKTNPIIEWADITGLSIADNNLTRSRAGASYTNAGAFSSSVLPAGQDGWVEMTAQNLNYTRILGLSSANTSNDFGVEFGLQFGGSANINILENGTSVTYLGKHVVGTVGRVSREGNQVKYYIDGVLRYTSTHTSTDSLYVDAGMYNLIGTIGNIQLSFGPQGAVPDDVEFQALKALYDSLDGPNWSDYSNWPDEGDWPATASNAEMGEWYGITVENGDVVSIDLSFNHLYGNVPAAIGDLKSLKRLILERNNISGSFPSTISNLTKLTNFGFRNIRLEGTFPDLSTLTSLDTLQLTNDFISFPTSQYDAGAMPTWIGNLTALRYLNLYQTNRTGSILSGFYNLVNLRQADLRRNGLTGSLASGFGNFTQLVKIELDENQLSGSLPTTIGALDALQILSITHNALTGSLPTEIGGMAAIKQLKLGDNQLSGALPSTIGQITTLNILDLHDNAFSGSLPTGISSLTALTSLWLSDNSFSGTVPSVSGLSNLTNAELANNAFTDVTAFEALTNIGYFDASGNSLTSLPDLSDSEDLNTFNVSGNATMAAGSVPGWLVSAYSLQYIGLGNTNRTGTLPSGLGSNAWSDATVDLSDNQLTGTIPSSYVSYPVYFLDLSGNDLSGEIPTLNSYFDKLDLSDNAFTGGIPEGTVDVRYLDLSHNQLSGELIDQDIEWDFIYAYYFDISYNNFEGALPGNIGNIASAWTPNGYISNADSLYLNFSHNQFTSISSRLWEITSDGRGDKYEFDFSHNFFRDFPEPPAPIANIVLDVSNNFLPQQVQDALSALGSPSTSIVTPQFANAAGGTIVFAIGQPLVLEGPGYEGLTIVWEKKDSIGNWQAVTTLNSDTTQASFTRSSSAVSDRGIYRWRLEDVAHDTKVSSGEFEAVDQGTMLIKNLAFQYKYDSRKRMTHKKVPGAAWMYMVYDNRDRLVLTQDGNQRARTPAEWTFTKYDALNRPVLTGIIKYDSAYSQEQMQQIVNDFYEGAPANKWYEDRNTWTYHHYSNRSFPTNIYEESEFLTVTFYDNYFELVDYIEPYGEFVYDTAQLSTTDGTYAAQDTAAFTRVIGQVTGTKVKNLETGAWYYTVNYYDDRYRVIQSVMQNHKGGVDKITNVYDFVGKVMRTKTSHTLATGPATTITRKFEYDHAGRLMKTWHQVNSDAYVLLSTNEYNELGQLVTKKLHSEDNGSTFKQHEDYRYNIRGWITRINNADLNTSDGGPQDFFGMEFGYNNDLGVGVFTPQYNGNISATKWSANLGLALPYLNEPTQRAYKFTYDPMNRLREANYALNPGGWSESLAFKEAMEYDQNGNILSLYRNNKKGSPMDWLVYDYGTGLNRSNKLRSVTDRGIATTGFRDKNTTGDDYAYDNNGNMTVDNNKGLGNIKYNSYLNLKEEINKTTGEKIKYIYNADGVKLAEEIYPAGSSTPSKRTDYVGGFVYENDTLKFIQHQEGKIMVPKPGASDPSMEYQYQIKDHLDNIRLTFTTKVKTDEFKATMEDTGIADYSNPRVQEMAYFGNLFETEIRNVNQWLNHTSNTIGNAVYLDGSEEKTIGPYTMLKVYPGDTVKMEVFGKYENKSSHTSTPLVAILAALINPIQSATVGIEGAAGMTSSSLMDGLIPLLTSKGSSSIAPAVYLNYILFDKDFKVADLGFNRIDEAAGFNTAAENTVAFDKMELERIIDRVGYLYVYVSNESEGTRVWLDDLTITYSQSPIVQFEDYYPFGLSQSETAFERGNDKYKGMVTTDGTGLKDLGFRQYDAATGRFDAVDPLAELQTDQSTYQYAGNNPVNQVDVLGLDQDDHDKDKRKKNKETRMVNGKKVKVHNGFVNKQQRRSERAANQRERQQARADRREQREQRREERAKNKESNKDEAHASNSDSEKGSGAGDFDRSAIVYVGVDGPPYPGEDRDKMLPKNIVNSLSNGSPDRVFNNYSDNVVLEASNNTSTLPIALVRSYEIAQKNPGVERTRQYLYSHHPINEARALYQRTLITASNNYQATLLKENIAVLNNTATSEDAIDPAPDDQIKCPTCPEGWEDLIEFKPPKSIYDKFAEENKSLLAGPASPPSTWYVHEMEDAAGGEINLDKYSVTITELPTVNGHQMTIEELFNHIRINLDDFKNDELTTFGDYPDTEFAGSERWATDDYLGVIKVFTAYLHVGVTVFDDLAVVASEQTETSWTFSTIHSPATNNHAVSGNRQFGFTDNGDGTYTIFTRGADIATGILDVLAGDAVFEGGEAIWNSFLDNIIQFVEQNSGSAGNKQTTSNRYDID